MVFWVLLPSKFCASISPNGSLFHTCFIQNSSSFLGPQHEMLCPTKFWVLHFIMLSDIFSYHNYICIFKQVYIFYSDTLHQNLNLILNDFSFITGGNVGFTCSCVICKWECCNNAVVILSALIIWISHNVLFLSIFT